MHKYIPCLFQYSISLSHWCVLLWIHNTQVKCSCVNKWQLIILLCTKCFGWEQKSHIIKWCNQYRPTCCVFYSHHAVRNQKISVVFKFTIRSFGAHENNWKHENYCWLKCCQHYTRDPSINWCCEFSIERNNVSEN